MQKEVNRPLIQWMERYEKKETAVSGFVYRPFETLEYKTEKKCDTLTKESSNGSGHRIP